MDIELKNSFDIAQTYFYRLKTINPNNSYDMPVLGEVYESKKNEEYTGNSDLG